MAKVFLTLTGGHLGNGKTCDNCGSCGNNADEVPGLYPDFVESPFERQYADDAPLGVEPMLPSFIEDKPINIEEHEN